MLHLNERQLFAALGPGSTSQDIAGMLRQVLSPGRLSSKALDHGILPAQIVASAIFEATQGVCALVYEAVHDCFHEVQDAFRDEESGYILNLIDLAAQLDPPKFFDEVLALAEVCNATKATKERRAVYSRALGYCGTPKLNARDWFRAALDRSPYYDDTARGSVYAYGWGGFVLVLEVAVVKVAPEQLFVASLFDMAAETGRPQEEELRNMAKALKELPDLDGFGEYRTSEASLEFFHLLQASESEVILDSYTPEFISELVFE